MSVQCGTRWSNFELRSGRLSSGQERKFIASTRGMHGYLEIKISPKIQEGRFQEIEVVGFRRLPTRVFMLHEVRREKRVFV